MKNWLSATCPVCGFRYPLKKFSSNLRAIDFPFQIVTGGGRARGFKVKQYIPWSTLPTMKKTEAWSSILSIYNRLSAAYDNYYEFLGFLSPKVLTLLQQYKSYEDVYKVTAAPEYSTIYSNATLNDFADSYSHADFTDSYTHLLMIGGLLYE